MEVGKSAFKILTGTPTEKRPLGSFFQFYLIWKKKTLDHWKKSCQGMGVPLEENKFLFSLNYADDQVIIVQDSDDLEFILKILN